MKRKALFAAVLSVSLLCGSVSAEAGGKAVVPAPTKTVEAKTEETTAEAVLSYEDRYKAEGKAVSVVDIDLKKEYRERLKAAKGRRYIIADGNNDAIPELYIFKTDVNGHAALQESDWDENGEFRGNLINMVYYGYKTVDSKKPELLERPVGREVTLHKEENKNEAAESKIYNYILDNKNHFAIECTGLSTLEQMKNVNNPYEPDSMSLSSGKLIMEGPRNYVSPSRTDYYAVYNHYDALILDYDFLGLFTPGRNTMTDFFNGKRLSGLRKNPVKLYYKNEATVMDKLKTNPLFSESTDNLRTFENYEFKTYYTSVKGEGGVYTAKK